MRTTTLGTMRSNAAWLADIPAPGFSNTEILIPDLNNRINEGLAELFNLVVAACGDEAYRKPTTFATVSGTSVYPLPSDYFECKGVELQLNQSNTSPLGADWIWLTTFTAVDRPFLSSSTPGWNGEPSRYRIQGKAASDASDPGSIELLPIPSANLNVRLWYVFAPPTLVNDSDTFDGFAGYEDYAVKYAAKWCAFKAENFDVADRLQAELDRISKNVLAQMSKRDGANPPKVSMTRAPWRPRYAARRF